MMDNLFVFCSQNKKQIKIYYENEYGCWLLINKLNFTDFKWPKKISAGGYEASEKVRYLVESIPASLKVVKIIKQSYKCDKCNKADNKLYYPISKSLFPGSIMSNSFIAYIAYHKYELGIPFHHLES
ncbi:MAG: transposase, partial [Acholeplasmataceae bacterium]|nr:transposase [Acholeplasmataceae bacterium]